MHKSTFHCIDFLVTFATSPQQARDIPLICPQRSPTFPYHVVLVPVIYYNNRNGLVTGFFQTNTTCRDGLKPRNFLVTFSFHGPRLRLFRDKDRKVAVLYLSQGCLGPGGWRRPNGI